MRSGSYTVATLVAIVEGHGLLRLSEDGRLVHVVPDTIDTCRHEVAIECRPPRAHLRTREVGKMTGAWPHVALKEFAVSSLHEVVPCPALVVDEVALLGFHTGVDHVNTLEMLLMQIVVQPARIGESVGVEGKDAVAIHIVDVHPDDIRRDVVFSEQVGDLHDTAVRIVGMATLVIAQRPQRRQRHVPGKVGKRLHELGYVRTFDDDDTEGGAHTFEDDILIGADGLSPRIVSDDAKGRAIAAQSHHPRVTLVEVCSSVDTVGRCINIP